MNSSQYQGYSSDVAANLAKVNDVINLSGVSPVKLIAVTKHASVDQLEEAHRLGVRDFGESKIQDALKKRAHLSPELIENIRWHFIGHLQTNKAKQAVGNFALIHSIDSLRLAKEVSRIAEAKNSVQAILLQVKMQEDENKGGFSPAELMDCMPELLSLKGLLIQGLMTISPLSDDAAIWCKSFIGLKQLRDELALKFNIELHELSMGMSDDWRDAIKYGSTMIRLGRAIFGN
ncbi:MAG: YggS family pyridoxal phosphate-dependent enzyme [Candidatus Obscuribacterales bacterium]|nr:YggS family pyridoxal phosphate-dependent enzyme [Candidatus Obscuribacterales bacterium]